MKYTVLPVTDKVIAERIIDFFLSKEAFNMDISVYGREARRKGVYDSLENEKHKFWYIKNDKEKIIASAGVNETERKNGGFCLDYFAVHKDYRRQKLGSRLLKKTEEFIKKQNGRFIIVDTGSTDLFAPARKFYEKNGYKRVSFIPDYYAIGDSRIDYYKKIK